MEQGRLPPRETGELDISAPVRVPGPPMRTRTRALLAAVALLAVAAILAATLPAAERGLAAQRAQATQTAATSRQVSAAKATETAYVRRAVATQTAAAQATASAQATIAAAATTAYSAAVPGCPLGDPLWHTQNFDPANPNFICAADSMQMISYANGHWGITYGDGARLAAHHDTQIHVYDISPNVKFVSFIDGVVMLNLQMDGSWQLYAQQEGQIASGWHALPNEFSMRIRLDSSQLTVWINSVAYANLSITNVQPQYMSAVSLDIVARDSSQQASIRMKDFAFTPLP